VLFWLLVLFLVLFFYTLLLFLQESCLIETLATFVLRILYPKCTAPYTFYMSKIGYQIRTTPNRLLKHRHRRQTEIVLLYSERNHHHLTIHT